MYTFHFDGQELTAEIIITDSEDVSKRRPFAEFREKPKADYTYEVEREFWEWELLETLKSHYQAWRE